MRAIGPRLAQAIGNLTVPASCLGIGLVSVLTELSYIDPPYTYYCNPTALFFLYDMATVALASAIALYARLGKTPRMLVSDNKNLTVACGLIVLSICLNYGSQALGLEVIAPYVVAAVVGGLGIALLFVMWFEVVSHLSPVQLTFCYAVAAIGRVSLIWLCGGMAFDRAWAFLCAAAVCSALLLAGSRQAVLAGAAMVGGLAGTTGKDNPREELCRFPLRPLMVVLTGTLLLSFVLRSIGNVWGTNGNPGVIVASIGVALILIRKGESFEFKRLWQVALISMALGVLLFVSLGGSGPLMVAGVLVSMAYELCLMLTYAILGDLVYRSFYNSTFLFAVELAVALAAGHLGNGLAMHLGAGLAESSVVMFVGVACVLGTLFSAACILAFSKRSMQETWGTIVKTPLSQDFDLLFEKTRLGLRCHELAQEANLSRREEEVLLLLAQRKRPAAIAEQLGIEASTVATHRKHVYQKLDVHSVKQLQERIGSSLQD